VKTGSLKQRFVVSFLEVAYLPPWLRGIGALGDIPYKLARVFHLPTFFLTPTSILIRPIIIVTLSRFIIVVIPFILILLILIGMLVSLLIGLHCVYRIRTRGRLVSLS